MQLMHVFPGAKVFGGHISGLGWIPIMYLQSDVGQGIGCSAAVGQKYPAGQSTPLDVPGTK